MGYHPYLAYSYARMSQAGHHTVGPSHAPSLLAQFMPPPAGRHTCSTHPLYTLLTVFLLPDDDDTYYLLGVGRDYLDTLRLTNVVLNLWYGPFTGTYLLTYFGTPPEPEPQPLTHNL